MDRLDTTGFDSATQSRAVMGGWSATLTRLGKSSPLSVLCQRMLMDGVDAATAAFEVGYESASQFNREYSRLFGQPPMRDIKALRETGGIAVSVL
jgi:AraC-like DNA-binding protein